MAGSHRLPQPSTPVRGGTRSRLSASFATEHATRHARMVSCHAQVVEVRPDTGPAGGAAVHLSAVEVRALWNILGLVAAGGSLTEKPEREMARRLQTELETALGD
jgi:hypothetical protein